MTNFTMHVGDCLETLKTLPDCSVDSVITDPPYGLSQHKPQQVIDCLTAWLKGEEYKPNGSGFMGKSWDAWVPSPAVWRECLRVLKPGGHMLAFAGTRSMDLMSMSVRLAGFELRDSIGYAHDGGGAPLLAWCYGSGFPKSLDVSKAIDKEAGAEREVVGPRVRLGDARAYPHNETGGNCYGAPNGAEARPPLSAPATDAARQWQGWGTALKPAWEPIILARKPLDGTVAENVIKHGTGAINVGGCRVEGAGPSGLKPYTRSTTPEVYGLGRAKAGRDVTYTDHPSGRWPANVIHDGSEAVVNKFPNSVSTGGLTLGGAKDGRTYSGVWAKKLSKSAGGFGDNGSAARFFYCAKASKRDRDEGLEGFAVKSAAERQCREDGMAGVGAYAGATGEARNFHPTVKPTALMRHLCRMVTPPGGIVLDPFMGSGSTGKAAMLEGFRFMGCELDPNYMTIAEARIRAACGDDNKQVLEAA